MSGDGLTLVPVVGDEHQLETLRELRNGVAKYMTRYTSWLTPEDQTNWWQNLDRDRVSVWLAYHTDAPNAVGYGLIRNDAEWRPHLTGAIHEDYRGRGLGRELFQGLERLALWPGRHVWLDVRADNVPALGLYRSLGYTQLHTRHDVGLDADITMMVKRRTGPQVGVLLFSYNRPVMLREALESIYHADNVILLDDGSDTFNPAAMLAELHPPWGIHGQTVGLTANGAIPASERMVTPTLGRLANSGLRALERAGLGPDDIVAYLCDDDLFHPLWLASVRRFMGEHPLLHTARGGWGAFGDGEPLRPLRPCMLDGRQLTTGNFVHRLRCFTEEGVRWDEGTVAIHDDQFTRNLGAVHPVWDAATPSVGTLAGWRREHAGNMMHWANGMWGYKPETQELFESGGVGQ